MAVAIAKKENQDVSDRVLAKSLEQLGLCSRRNQNQGHHQTASAVLQATIPKIRM